MPICDVVSFRLELPPYDCERDNQPKYRLRIATLLNELRMVYDATAFEIRKEEERYLPPKEENRRFLQHHRHFGWNCLPPWEADNPEANGPIIDPDEEEKARIRWTRRVKQGERYITAFLLKYCSFPNGNGGLYGVELTDRVQRSDDPVINKIQNTGKKLVEVVQRQSMPLKASVTVRGRTVHIV